jgi:hypothetical protein
MRMMKTILCLAILALMVQAPAYATISAGLEWSNQGETGVNTAKIDWDISNHWTLRGTYNWDIEDLSAGLVYHLDSDNKVFRPYAGIGVRDLLQKSDQDLSFGEKVEIIAGVTLDLGANRRTGVYLTAELKAVPATVFNNPDSERLDPIVSATINYRIPHQPSQTRRPRNISESDYELLSRLVTAEASGEPFEGQVAVAAVVLNRVASSKFPNTIREVIYQDGQFSSLPKLPAVTPAESCRRAVAAALNGDDPSRGALYFYNPRTSSPEGLRFFRSGRLRVLVTIGNHVFLTE